MVTSSWTRLAVATGGLALSLATGAGIAAADPAPAPDPDLERVINSTCTYDQATAALNTQYPDDAAKFNGSPIAQGFLHQFVDSPPDQRRQLAAQIQGMPDAQPYLQTMKNVAKICNKY
ncbi:hemophore-related protein [Mycobacterium paraffinicum]|uniref:Hemophore-related protein n=1 Tax=Mycobacterium paraffinicum TaxID=53378 RepID=A0ABP8RBJ1_9MYCO|nr:hemophore-related protein [Mycobacterium paraffinicum]MCV7313283.1 hemophore-related protein [Mycobacterium paraffinicum]